MKQVVLIFMFLVLSLNAKALWVTGYDPSISEMRCESENSKEVAGLKLPTPQNSKQVINFFSVLGINCSEMPTKMSPAPVAAVNCVRNGGEQFASVFFSDESVCKGFVEAVKARPKQPNETGVARIQNILNDANLKIQVVAAKPGSAPAESAQALEVLPNGCKKVDVLTVATQAKAVPRTLKDGKKSGFRIYFIKQGSHYDKLGLKNNDVILEIDKAPVHTELDMVNLFDFSKNKNKQIQIERAGKVQALVATCP